LTSEYGYVLDELKKVTKFVIEKVEVNNIVFGDEIIKILLINYIKQKQFNEIINAKLEKFEV